MRLNNEYRYLSRFLRDNCKQGYEIPEPGKCRILYTKWERIKDTAKTYAKVAGAIAGGALVLGALTYSAIKGFNKQSEWDNSNIQKKFNTKVTETFNPKTIDNLIKE